jgi:hypothetical protein
MNPHYEAVAQRADCRCEYCRAPEIVFNFPFEVEHITPVSRQGTDNDTNLALACRACNLHKSDCLMWHDEETQTDVRLFHPRRDRWEEHFRVDVESGSILGLTPTGRATVERLQMNSAVQLVARRHWMRLGVFP